MEVLEVLHQTKFVFVFYYYPGGQHRERRASIAVLASDMYVLMTSCHVKCRGCVRLLEGGCNSTSITLASPERDLVDESGEYSHC